MSNACQGRSGQGVLLRQYGGKRHQRSVKAVKATRDKRPGGYVVKIVSGSILTKMMGSRQTWLRFALVLAVSLATWADAALEAFVCPHLSGCPHEIAGNVRTSLSNTAVSEHARHSNLHRMPCCPQPAQASWQCDMAMRDCCAGKHREPPSRGSPGCFQTPGTGPSGSRILGGRS